MIFDRFERTDPNPAHHSESRFQFLNRCDSIAVEKIRLELEQWLSHYPVECRTELCARFKTDFNPPFYELLLHELLIKQNHSVSVHPSVGEKGAKPDFAVMTRSGKPLILEAACCYDIVESDSNSPRMNQIYDAINAMRCREFFVSIQDVRFKSEKQPSSRRIVSYLKKQLSNYDPQSFSSESKYHELPRFSFKDDSIIIEFQLIPKSPEAWDREDIRTIGAYSGSCQWGDSTETIRERLRTKAMSYGQLMQPYVIAMNLVDSWGVVNDEVLYGTKKVADAIAGQRLKDGFWGTSNSPKHTRVSAVILGLAVPANIPRIDFCLYRNPWAKFPLPTDFWKLPSATLVNGSMVRENDSITTGQILGLPTDWPGDLFPQRRK